MRPEPPADFQPTVVERLGLQRLFSQTARMVLRQLERQPVRAGLSVLGIAMGVSVLVLGRFMNDALDYLIDFQFFIAQRQDITLTFVEPTSSSVMHEVNQLPGVFAGEPLRSVHVYIRHRHREKRTAITGLPPHRQLQRLLDANEQEVSLPPDGMIVSDKLAQLLDAKPGDWLTVDVREGERPTKRIRLMGLIHDYSGTNAYMRLDALNRLMREGDSISGVHVKVDKRYLPQLYDELKRTPRVAGVMVKEATLQGFNDTIKENQLRMQFFNVMFAMVICFGVIYNTARISLSERSRELATLRVIGFTRMEISAILLGELMVLTLLALPVGMAIGYGLAALMVSAFETDLYRLPLVVQPATFAFAAIVTIIASVVSGLIVRRKLDELDLVAVLKAKE